VTSVRAGAVRLDSASGRWVLGAMVMGSGVVTLDATVVNIALPRLGADLDAGFDGLQWVVTGYTLTLASLILLGGALGDRFGRRRVFCIGLGWFTVASVMCAAAPSIGVLVASRLLQGVGGALLTPGSLAIISATFHPDDRARAVGAWSGFGGITTAIGPFLGGWLVSAASWRWIFVINVPLAAAVVLITLRHVPESIDDRAPPSLDVAGAVIGTAGLALTTYALIEQNWPIGVLGIVGLGAFLVVEWRSSHPMLPLEMFTNHQFSAANAVTFVVYGALGLILFMIGIVLQTALGYSPLEAGASLIPVTAIMLVFSAQAGALAQRIGPRIPMSVGPAVVAIGLALMVRIDAGVSYAAGVLPAVIVFGAGLALTVAPLTATVLAAAEERHAGIASGVNNAVARAASLLAVSALPLLSGIDTRGTVAPDALVRGFHTVAWIAAGACIVGGALSALTISDRTLAEAAGAQPLPEPCFHCGLDATPLTRPVPSRRV
jgi:EmrB/QacA subfamily drug resistance transporter